MISLFDAERVVISCVRRPRTGVEPPVVPNSTLAADSFEREIHDPLCSVEDLEEL